MKLYQDIHDLHGQAQYLKREQKCLQKELAAAAAAASAAGGTAVGAASTAAGAALAAVAAGPQQPGLEQLQGQLRLVNSQLSDVERELKPLRQQWSLTPFVYDGK